MTLSSSQLRRAAALQEKIEALQVELAQLLGGSSKAPSTSSSKADKPEKKKRVMSAAARKKIADAQRKRWAKQKSADPASEKKAK
ncbi:MAG: hypothetical protein B7Z37_28545 [Verrucomicrobia bacterium 12-59-8]|nr:MAG: hypothetical protein B7Z37_28545 [Verrucomicrobia bacterium 12-59-8]